MGSTDSGRTPPGRGARRTGAEDGPAGAGTRPRAGEAEAADDRADPTLIRWMLGLTSEQRLEALQGFVNSVWELRHGPKA